MKLGTRRYYVGTRDLPNLSGIGTLAEAIAKGRALIESGDRDEAYIVEVVKVVRRKEVPVTVEDVK